jgi:hypothetical protein
MSNTKKWKSVSKTMRKGIKRSERKALKKLYAGLTAAQRSKFNNPEEKAGIRQFLAALKK